MEANALESLLEQESVPQKAYFLLEEDAEIEDISTGNIIQWKAKDKFVVQLNPTSYNIRKSTEFQPKGDFNGQYTANYGEFQNNSPKTLHMTLLFDAFFALEQKSGAKTTSTLSFQTESITGESNTMTAKQESRAIDLQKVYIEKILSLTNCAKKTSRPPLVTFQYGSVSFTGYMEFVDVQYKRFDKEGEPIRVEVTLSMKECKKE